MVVCAPSAIIVTSSRATGRSNGASSQSSGIEAADGLHVQAPAGDVLGAGVVAALEDHDLEAGLGQAVGRGEAGEAATDDDALDCFHVTSPGWS